MRIPHTVQIFLIVSFFILTFAAAFAFPPHITTLPSGLTCEGTSL